MIQLSEFLPPRPEESWKLIRQVGVDNVVAYTASKGALNALCRAMAVDEAAYGVRVNSIAPGSVDTPMLRTSAAETMSSHRSN